MSDSCGEHGLVPDVEIIAIQDINEAYFRMLKGDVKYRLVIDLSHCVTSKRGSSGLPEWSAPTGYSAL